MITKAVDSPNARIEDGEAYWQAVLTRDARFDKTFVYGVRSTGIYCRPSCPSRRPERQQAMFYPSPEAAERAGFRPCRRCRPRETGAHSPLAQLVSRLCYEIEASLEDMNGDRSPLSLAALSAAVGVSSHHLQRSFKRLMGITPRQYADAHRLERLKTRLKDGEDVTGALYQAGYGSSRSLYERAPSQLGMTPGTYRKGGRGMRIGYTVVNCPLGRLLVAATERGVCSVCLGDSTANLKEALLQEYPDAEIHFERGGLSRWVGAILSHLRGQTPSLDLPVDVQATAFQWRVWQELRRIPYGSTRSYSDVARALGHPRAARAVARACATNPVAVVIPCHRVVRGDGSPGGYRWGLERKRALLAREGLANAADGAFPGRREPGSGKQPSGKRGDGGAGLDGEKFSS